MARIHVFAIDFVPEPEDVASGGGLRSLQVISALREAGHSVSVSVPAESRAVRALAVRDPERRRHLDCHDESNQIDLLRRHRPDAVFWLWPTMRQVPLGGLGDMAHVCDLNGLQDYEIANGTAALLTHARGLLADACRGADVVLTGAPEQHGYWLARLGEQDAPQALLCPYALPDAFQGKVVSGATRLARLHVIGNIHSWSTSTALLERTAIWVGRRPDIRLHLIGGTDPGGATPLADLKALRMLEAMDRVEVLPEASFRDAMAAFAPGSLALDVTVPTVERQLAVPIRTVNALAHGVPVVTTVDSPLMRRLREAEAAILADGSEDGLARALDAAAALSPEGFGRMSAAAHAFATRHFNPREAAAAIGEAAEVALHRRRRHIAIWQAPSTAAPAALGHVLVISGEMQNIRELRIDVPFGALHRRRLIAGYTVWDKGRVVFSTRAETAGENPDQGFDAIWVQRSVSAEVALVLDGLGCPFVYDIDDNLLVSPRFRDAFSAESMQAARSFVRRAAVLSCSTARLALMLQRHAATRIMDKAVVAQNLLRSPPAARPAGEPGCIVWASSDMPALTETRLAVTRAVRDFCLTHALRVVCIGAPPSPLLQEAEIEVEHVGLLPYPAYLDLLRTLAPAIMVCPLETGADPETQDFVDGKSDIKMLQALSTGLVGLFSDARPYRESDLPPALLCENTYRGWFEGLARARRACLEASPPPVLPPWRLAGQRGAMAVHEALLRARLPRPLHLGAITDRLALIRGRLARRMLGPEEFDEAWYLTKYTDIRFALERGTIGSAYDHYVRNGFAEGRMGRDGDGGEGSGEQWWANLMHTVSDLRTVVENRTPQIEELKSRRSMRLRLRHEGRR